MWWSRFTRQGLSRAAGMLLAALVIASVMAILSFMAMNRLAPEAARHSWRSFLTCLAYQPLQRVDLRKEGMILELAKFEMLLDVDHQIYLYPEAKKSFFCPPEGPSFTGSLKFYPAGDLSLDRECYVIHARLPDPYETRLSYGWKNPRTGEDVCLRIVPEGR